MPRKRVLSLTPKKQAAFLTALADSGNVRQAARQACLSIQTVYKYRQRDPVFARAWEATLSEAMDTVLEPEAVRRAVEGVEKPVYHQGRQVGSVREYSDTLLIFLLKGGKPERYKERREVWHRGTLALLHKLERIGAMTPDELQAFLLEVETYTNGLEA